MNYIFCPYSICCVFISEQTATCATYIINWWVFITEMKSVYNAVRTGALNKAVCASSLKVFCVFAFSVNSLTKLIVIIIIIIILLLFWVEIFNPSIQTAVAVWNFVTCAFNGKFAHSTFLTYAIYGTSNGSIRNQSIFSVKLWVKVSPSARYFCS